MTTVQNMLPAKWELFAPQFDIEAHLEKVVLAPGASFESLAPDLKILAARKYDAAQHFASYAQGMIDEYDRDHGHHADDLDRHITQRAGTDLFRVLPSNEKRFRHSVANWLFLNGVLLPLAFVDLTAGVYVAAGYLASSGKLDTATTITQALPYAFPIALAMFVIKAWISNYAAKTNRAMRTYFTIAGAIGILATLVFLGFYAVNFNPGSASLDLMSSGSLTGIGELGAFSGIGLVFTHMLLSIFGGGPILTAYFSGIHGNKVHKTVESEEREYLNSAIMTGQSVSKDIIKECSAAKDYLRRLEGEREAYVTYVLGCLRFAIRQMEHDQFEGMKARLAARAAEHPPVPSPQPTPSAPTFN